MVKRNFVIFIFIFAFCCSAFSQDYSFGLQEEYVNVIVNRDASIDIQYIFTFHCLPGAHPIDIVDVGCPNDDYVLTSENAWIDEHLITDIRKSLLSS